MLDDRFRPAVRERRRRGWSGSTTAAAGPRARSTSRLAAADLERHPQRPDAALGRDDRRGRRLPLPGRPHQRQHPRPRRAAWSPASRATAASPAPSTTARSPCSPTASRASGSTARTTRSVHSDGSIWFSDPDFGITSDYEGHRAESEIGACNVYRDRPGDRRGPPGRRRLRRPQRPGLLPRRAAALRLRHPGRPASASSTYARTARSPTARSSPKRGPAAAASTTSASTTRAGCGPPPWTTACTATTPTAP